MTMLQVYCSYYWVSNESAKPAHACLTIMAVDNSLIVSMNVIMASCSAIVPALLLLRMDILHVNQEALQSIAVTAQMHSQLQHRSRTCLCAGITCHFCRQKKLCGEEDCPRCSKRNVDQSCIGQSSCCCYAKKRKTSAAYRIDFSIDALTNDGSTVQHPTRQLTILPVQSAHWLLSVLP